MLVDQGTTLSMDYRYIEADVRIVQGEKILLWFVSVYFPQ